MVGNIFSVSFRDVIIGLKYVSSTKMNFSSVLATPTLASVDIGRLVFCVLDAFFRKMLFGPRKKKIACQNLNVLLYR